MKPPHDFIASVSTAELAALDRAISMIDRGLRTMDTVSAEPLEVDTQEHSDYQKDKSNTHIRRTLSECDAAACAILVQHPDWTATRIAKELGIPRTNLYRLEKFLMAREVLESQRYTRPVGRKDMGYLEATDDRQTG